MSASMGRWAGLGVLCAASAWAVLAQERGEHESPGAPGHTAVAVGTEAPAFEAESLSGKEIKFPTGYKGKIVLVDFWATWCPPCRAEIPHLRKAYKEYHEDGLEIVGISLDEARHVSREKVQRFMKKHEMPWEQIYEDVAGIASQYHVEFIPAPYLMDGDTGVILAKDKTLKGRSLAKTIKKHLASKTGKSRKGNGESDER